MTVPVMNFPFDRHVPALNSGDALECSGKSKTSRTVP